MAARRLQGGHGQGAQVHGMVEELFAGMHIHIRKMQVVFLVIYERSQRKGGNKESACDAEDTGDLGSIPGWEDPLEKEMATNSSFLAWEIPWTEEPDRLQSMGLQESETT